MIFFNCGYHRQDYENDLDHPYLLQLGDTKIMVWGVSTSDFPDDQNKNINLIGKIGGFFERSFVFGMKRYSNRDKFRSQEEQDIAVAVIKKALSYRFSYEGELVRRDGEKILPDEIDLLDMDSDEGIEYFFETYTSVKEYVRLKDIEVEFTPALLSQLKNGALIGKNGALIGE